MIKGIKYVAIQPPSGYGEAAKRAILALAAHQIPITLEISEHKPLTTPELTPFYHRKIDYDTVILHTGPDQFPEWVAREKGKKIFAYTVWETDRIPQKWHEWLAGVDHILVPCQWNREVFINSGIRKPIDVYPHICASSVPDSDNIFPEIDPDTFVFYTIGLYSSRKSIFHTIKAYLQTFRRTDNTLLVIKSNPYNLNFELFDRCLLKTRDTIKLFHWRYPFSARIKLITDDLSDADIWALHKRGDCYVSLCRAEGWGMGAFDAATLGKPVIMTGYGGQVDFLARDLSYLVDYRVVPAIGRGFEKTIFTPEQNWAEPDVAHGGQLMRAVYQDQQAAKQRAARLAQQIQQKFSARIITENLLSIIAKYSYEPVNT